MTKCTRDFFDTGFYELKLCPENTQYTIWRTSQITGGADTAALNEVRFYQTPNLLQELANLGISVTIDAPTAIPVNLAPTNLITNFENRQGTNMYSAVTGDG